MLDPVVSIKTITYNHVPYIRRCIESVLMQKTEFPFEMVIGEDCSTDGTREIVIEYAEKYPEIIRVITSEANVGVRENSHRTNLACRGKYIALCEGDDYWIDPYKLQKQHDAIIENDAVLVTHSSIFLRYDDGKLAFCNLKHYQDQSGLLSVEDIIMKNPEFHTSTLFFKKEIILEKPDWCRNILFGQDMTLKLYASLVGKFYFIEDIMSVYQNGGPSSWTTKNTIKRLKDESWRIAYEKSFIEMYKNFDKYSDYKYSKTVFERVRKRFVNYLRMFGNFNFLDVGASEKGKIRTTMLFAKFVPARYQERIIQKLVDLYIPLVFEAHEQ